jgi:photosynthetic reaction center cytochrome c subunit
MVYYANSVMGRVPTQIDYSDYRAVAGVKIPFKWTYGWVSGQEQYAFTEAQADVAIPDSAFTNPSARK